MLEKKLSKGNSLEVYVAISRKKLHGLYYWSFYYLKIPENESERKFWELTVWGRDQASVLLSVGNT